jgi:AbrB family looped-hinge helix DNA binding protein
MQTTISIRGKVVVPSKIRRALGLRPGDLLDVTLDGNHIVLTPRRSRARSARIIKDPITGLPVLSVRPRISKLTSAQVRKILAHFP